MSHGGWLVSRKQHHLAACWVSSDVLMKPPRTTSASLAELRSGQEPLKTLAPHPRPAASGSLEGGAQELCLIFWIGGIGSLNMQRACDFLHPEYLLSLLSRISFFF